MMFLYPAHLSKSHKAPQPKGQNPLGELVGN